MLRGTIVMFFKWSVRYFSQCPQCLFGDVPFYCTSCTNFTQSFLCVMSSVLEFMFWYYCEDDSLTNKVMKILNAILNLHCTSPKCLRLDLFEVERLLVEQATNSSNSKNRSSDFTITEED
jgi:hypothetical protein